jgi:hypothetical protein
MRQIYLPQMTFGMISHDEVDFSICISGSKPPRRKRKNFDFDFFQQLGIKLFLKTIGAYTENTQPFQKKYSSLDQMPLEGTEFLYSISYVSFTDYISFISKSGEKVRKIFFTLQPRLLSCNDGLVKRRRKKML